MAWFKVDDGFWAHPKILMLSDGAQALWLRAGSWSSQQLTDGFIPETALPMLRGTVEAATELVSAGMWDRLPDGWGFHDWEKYQPTREQVEGERQATRERLQRWRANRRTGNAVGNGVTNGVSNAAPSRPVPSRPDPDINHLGLSGHLPVRAREESDDQFQSLIDGIGIDVAAIQRTVHETLGVEIGPRFVWVLWEKFSSDAKAPIRRPTAYLRKSITDTPGNAEKALFEAGWAA